MSEREDTAAPAPASPRETREHDALKVEMTAELVASLERRGSGFSGRAWFPRFVPATFLLSAGPRPETFR